MAKDVKCSVSSCHYYVEGNCEASCIHVGKCKCHNAKEQCETECGTFKLKK